jgi:hypothetical protein
MRVTPPDAICGSVALLDQAFCYCYPSSGTDRIPDDLSQLKVKTYTLSSEASSSEM